MTVATQPRVLVVDDSRLVRTAIARRIRPGVDVREATDGEDAWQTLLVDPSIRVVLTDLDMPVLDGFGLLGRIRASGIPRISTLPVVVLSGAEDAEATARARASGATDCLEKGVEATQLIACLAACMGLPAEQSGTVPDRTPEKPATPAAEDVPVGPPAPAFFVPPALKHQGEQCLAAARRHNLDLALLVIEIGDVPALRTRFGESIVKPLEEKLHDLVRRRLRREDVLARIGGGRIAILCPALTAEGATGFARRLACLVESARVSVGGVPVGLKLHAGHCDIHADAPPEIEGMIRMAIARLSAAAGVVGETATNGGRSSCVKAVVPPERSADGISPPVATTLREAGLSVPVIRQAPPSKVSVDHAVDLIHAGNAQDVCAALPELASALLPLLALMQAEFGIDMPLARLAQAVSDYNPCKEHDVKNERKRERQLHSEGVLNEQV